INHVSHLHSSSRKTLLRDGNHREGKGIHEECGKADSPDSGREDFESGEDVDCFCLLFHDEHEIELVDGIGVDDVVDVGVFLPEGTRRVHLKFL
ncbi:hypothetical protein PMAYCL1PPCAC_22513, partial [Pristionchus mayeri]